MLAITRAHGDDVRSDGYELSAGLLVPLAACGADRERNLIARTAFITGAAENVASHQHQDGVIVEWGPAVAPELVNGFPEKAQRSTLAPLTTKATRACRARKGVSARQNEPETGGVGSGADASVVFRAMVLRFSGVIKIRDGNPYLLVSARRAAELKPGWRRPLPVLLKINGVPAKAWRINMMPAGDGSFYLYLHGSVRTASRTKVGDRVNAEVAFDADYRSGPAHPMPRAFRSALAAEPQALAAWKALIPSRQKEILRYLAQLKSEAARERNIERAVYVLSGNEGRFMARTWQRGR